MAPPPQPSPRAPSSAEQAPSRREGSVTVAVSLRLRPEIPHLDGPSDTSRSVEVVDLHASGKAASYRGTAYRFAHTFDTSTPSSDIFNTHRDRVLGVLDGFDATLMAYGATGSGKTFTMIGTDEQPGLMPLAIDALFERIASSSSHAGQTYALRVSAMELLEEKCSDLLHGRAPVVLRSNGGGGGASAHRGGGAGISFHGLKDVPVKSRAELLECIEAATRERTTLANYRHDESSRSHMIVRLTVDGARLVHLSPAALGQAAGVPDTTDTKASPPGACTPTPDDETLGG